MRMWLASAAGMLEAPDADEVADDRSALLARIALMQGKTLRWDAKAERVTNDADSNRLLGYEYRAPHKLG